MRLFLTRQRRLHVLLPYYREYGCDLDSIPPQVFELRQLIEEGEEFIRGLASKEGFIETLAALLLTGDESPASKLSRLSVDIQQAESRMQLSKAVHLMQQKSQKDQQELVSLKRQMELLQKSITQLNVVETKIQTETNDARQVREYLQARKISIPNPFKLIKRIRGQERERETSIMLENLKANAAATGTESAAKIVQELEEKSVPLKIETPKPANEKKRLRVLRDLRLVQKEMDGVPVGDGFEYHRSEIIRTIIQVLQLTLPAFAGGASLQVVGDQDSYTITGENVEVPVVPRSQVPCQHVICLTDADKARLSVDGFTSHDVLAIRLRKKHKDLTKNFCYSMDTVTYIGAAIRINGVSIGSLCMASDKTIEELGWNNEKSRYLRTVAGVLEDQLTRLCVDWAVYGGIPPEWDHDSVFDQLLAAAHADA
jgi:hypothetical protein